MSIETIAEKAREVFDEYEDKSTNWCLQFTADQCDCEYGDVVDAITQHPEISGFKERK